MAKSELCTKCAHDSVCCNDKHILGDVFIPGNPMLFDNAKLYREYEERKAKGFPCNNFLSADVAEVVRCKECKHMTSHYDTDGNVPYWTCSEWDGGTDYDGYCHYGERKQDG